MTAHFWIINSDLSLSRRWESLLRRQGWVAALESEFLRFKSQATVQGAGFVLAEWEVLRPYPPETVRSFKEEIKHISILLTAHSLKTEQVVSVLEAGADDYFEHSIDGKLLVAKLKAHLRRLESQGLKLEILKSPGGELKLDPSRHRIWTRSRGRWMEVVGLTPTEFQFLALFLQQPGAVLARESILEAVSQRSLDSVRLGTVDKHIESLRKKLGRHGSMIRTVYGVGYALRGNS